MKFEKVMFSQVSVCPRGGVCSIACWDTHLPGQTPPLGRHPPGRHPPAQCMLGYSQQMGSTHSTGMHSCYSSKFEVMLNPHDPITDDYFSCTTNLRNWKVPLSGENPLIFISYEIGNQENTVTKTNDELGHNHTERQASSVKRKL